MQDGRMIFIEDFKNLLDCYKIRLRGVEGQAPGDVSGVGGEECGRHHGEDPYCEAGGEAYLGSGRREWRRACAEDAFRCARLSSFVLCRGPFGDLWCHFARCAVMVRWVPSHPDAPDPSIGSPHR